MLFRSGDQGEQPLQQPQRQVRPYGATGVDAEEHQRFVSQQQQRQHGRQANTVGAATPQAGQTAGRLWRALPWSVFECRLQPHQLQQLRQGLMRIATADDSVRLWMLPHWTPAAEQLGKPVEAAVWEDKVI